MNSPSPKYVIVHWSYRPYDDLDLMVERFVELILRKPECPTSLYEGGHFMLDVSPASYLGYKVYMLFCSRYSEGSRAIINNLLNRKFLKTYPSLKTRYLLDFNPNKELTLGIPLETWIS